MRTTPLETRIEEIITPAADTLGLSLVQVKVTGEGGHRTVQIMAEDPETGKLNIGACQALSKSASTLLDVEDPIDGAYRLEVSSPGIDRPLTRTEDFETYKGFEAKMETFTAAENGQRRFRGRIRGIEDDIIALDTDQGDVTIRFSDLTKAKLVLTDELIKATADR